MNLEAPQLVAREIDGPDVTAVRGEAPSVQGGQIEAQD